MNLTLMRYCGHFLIKAEGGAKNYKCEHPLPSLSCSEKGYYSFNIEKNNSTGEVGFNFSLKLKNICMVGKKRATEVS